MRWPWRRRANGEAAKQASRDADDQVRAAEEKTRRVDRTARTAQEQARAADRFAREFQRSMHIRGQT
jgi:hypothetical protein